MFQFKFLIKIVGRTRLKIIRPVLVRRRTYVEQEIDTKFDRSVLRLPGYVKRMDGNSLSKKVKNESVHSETPRGKRMFSCMNNIKAVLI